MKYLGNCTHLEGEVIQEMQDQATEVSWQIIKRRVGGEVINQIFPNQCPPLEHDWSVSFYKSRFQGVSCYFIEHSRIEHIFV